MRIISVVESSRMTNTRNTNSTPIYSFTGSIYSSFGPETLRKRRFACKGCSHRGRGSVEGRWSFVFYHQVAIQVGGLENIVIKGTALFPGAIKNRCQSKCFSKLSYSKSLPTGLFQPTLNANERYYTVENKIYLFSYHFHNIFMFLD